MSATNDAKFERAWMRLTKSRNPDDLGSGELELLEALDAGNYKGTADLKKHVSPRSDNQSRNGQFIVGELKRLQGWGLVEGKHAYTRILWRRTALGSAALADQRRSPFPSAPLPVSKEEIRDERE